MNSRKQFNKKLSDFQYLQFKYADMASDLVSSRYLYFFIRDLSFVKQPNLSTWMTQIKQFTQPWLRK